MPSIGCDYSASECFLAISSKERVLHTFKLKLAGDLSEQRRNYFYSIQKVLQTILEEFPDCKRELYIEEPWVAGMHFPQAAIKLARNCAYIELAALESNMEVRFVHISTWRKGVYGNGKPQNPKGTAIAWVLYNLGYETKNHNLAEAACIGYYGETR